MTLEIFREGLRWIEGWACATSAETNSWRASNRFSNLDSPQLIFGLVVSIVDIPPDIHLSTRLGRHVAAMVNPAFQNRLVESRDAFSKPL